MPNNEMDYSLIHRTPDGNGKILVTTPGSPDKGSWETESELKTYVNQDVVMQTDIVQSLGQQIDKVPSNKAVDDAINAINVTSKTVLLSHSFEQGDSSWQSWSDYFSNTYKKYLLFVSCVGGDWNSIIFTADEYSAVGADYIAVSAQWDSSTRIVATMASGNKLSASAKTGSLGCNVLLFGLS